MLCFHVQFVKYLTDDKDTFQVSNHLGWVVFAHYSEEAIALVESIGLDTDEGGEYEGYHLRAELTTPIKEHVYELG